MNPVIQAHIGQLHSFAQYSYLSPAIGDVAQAADEMAQKAASQPPAEPVDPLEADTFAAPGFDSGLDVTHQAKEVAKLWDKAAPLLEQLRETIAKRREQIKLTELPAAREKTEKLLIKAGLPERHVGVSRTFLVDACKPVSDLLAEDSKLRLLGSQVPGQRGQIPERKDELRRLITAQVGVPVGTT